MIDLYTENLHKKLNNDNNKSKASPLRGTSENETHYLNFHSIPLCLHTHPITLYINHVLVL